MISTPFSIRRMCSLLSLHSLLSVTAPRTLLLQRSLPHFHCQHNFLSHSFHNYLAKQKINKFVFLRICLVTAYTAPISSPLPLHPLHLFSHSLCVPLYSCLRFVLLFFMQSNEGRKNVCIFAFFYFTFDASFFLFRRFLFSTRHLVFSHQQQVFSSSSFFFPYFVLETKSLKDQNENAKKKSS